MQEAIGIHHPAFSVPKQEIFTWLNQLLQLEYTKIEQLGTGAAYCQVLDAIYPGQVQMNKVVWEANQEYQILQNYKVLTNAFHILKIQKFVDVNKLKLCRPLDNIEFIQWLKYYYDKNAQSNNNYNALQRRGHQKIQKKLEKENKQGSTNPNGQQFLGQNLQFKDSNVSMMNQNSNNHSNQYQRQTLQENIQINNTNSNGNFSSELNKYEYTFNCKIENQSMNIEQEQSMKIELEPQKKQFCQKDNLISLSNQNSHQSQQQLQQNLYGEIFQNQQHNSNQFPTIINQNSLTFNPNNNNLFFQNEISNHQEQLQQTLFNQQSNLPNNIIQQNENSIHQSLQSQQIQHMSQQQLINSSQQQHHMSQQQLEHQSQQIQHQSQNKCEFNNINQPENFSQQQQQQQPINILCQNNNSNSGFFGNNNLNQQYYPQTDSQMNFKDPQIKTQNNEFQLLSQ